VIGLDVEAGVVFRSGWINGVDVPLVAGVCVPDDEREENEEWRPFDDDSDDGLVTCDTVLDNGNGH